MEENENPGNQKKTILRAPPRSVELTSTLDRIKTHQRLGEQKHYFYVRITLIITSLISLCLGIYIFINFDSFFSKDYNFNDRNSLLFFYYIYSPSAIGIMFVSLILSLFIYTFYCCCEKEKIVGAPLYDENDTSLSMGELQNYEESNNGINNKKPIHEVKEYIGINADKVTLFPYTLTIFVIMTMVFYFAALPYSITLLVKLYKDSVYNDIVRFWALYIFILANLINGILLVVVFFHMFCVKRIENNILKKNMEIDENLITSLRREVREALKKPN